MSSSILVPCPHCIAKVRDDNLNSHIQRVHGGNRPKSAQVRVDTFSNRNTGYPTRRSSRYRDYTAECHRRAPSPLSWSWDKGTYANSNDTYSEASDDVGSVTQEFYMTRRVSSPVVVTNGLYSHRSSVTSLSETSDIPNISDQLYLSDRETNRPLTKRRGSDDWIVFSTPTMVFTQRRSHGLKCPVPDCTSIFVEVEEVVQHAFTAHFLEKCPYCKGVNLKPYSKIGDHIKQVHKINTQNRYTTPKTPPTQSTSNGHNYKIPSTTNNGSRISSSRCRVETNKSNTNYNYEKPAKKTEAKGNTQEILPSKFTSKSQLKAPLVSKGIPKGSQSNSSNINKPIPSTPQANKPKAIVQKTTKSTSEIKQVKSAHNITSQKPVTTVIKPPTIVVGAVKSKHLSRPTTPNTSLPTSCFVNKTGETINTKCPSVLSSGKQNVSSATDVSDRNVEAEHNLQVKKVSNGNSNKDVEYINAFRDAVLEKDTNFKFIDTGDLVGYSLNIT